MTWLTDCPACGSTIANHCRAAGYPGRSCTWVKCMACGGYGTRDGRRWVPGRRIT